MVQIRQIQGMAHLVAENIRIEHRRWCAFKLEIKRVETNAIDGGHITQRIVGEVLHVGPQYGCPLSRATLHDETDVVDVAIPIAIEHNVGIHQMQGIDILHNTAQQERLAHRDSHKRILPLVADGIPRTIGLEIAAWENILVRNNLTVLYIIGIDCVIMNLVVRQGLEEIINA